MKELKEARMGMIAVSAVMLVSIMRRLMEARGSSSRMMTLVVAGVVLLLVAGGVSAEFACVADDVSGDAYFCGDTVMKSCTLNGSMTCTDGTTYGLIVGASDITINGAGFNITGARSVSVCEVGIVAGDTGEQNPAKHSGIISQFDNVVIKNIEIKNFCGGIGIGDSGHNHVENNTVIGCNIHECGDSTYDTQGIHMVHTSNCSITKNDIHSIDGSGISAGCSGGGNGIFMYGKGSKARGWYNIITCNNLHHNVKSGFFTKHQCMYNTISYNRATHNTQSGIMPKCEMTNYNKFEYNNMSYNGVNGFYLGGDGNTIRYNTMLNNGAEGLGLKDTADSNTITNNTACGNGGTGDMAWTDVTNIGDSNTCDSGPAGACDWSCDTKVPVYYDFDSDVPHSPDPLKPYYSAATCDCGNLLSVGACCNPGLFANAGAGDHCNYDANGNGFDVCILTPGFDPNDCSPVPELATAMLFGLGLVGLVGYIRVSRRGKD